MTGTARRLLLAGTAGGVGTTTVTALLFSKLYESGAAPTLLDHTAGVLGARLPDGDQVRQLSDQLLLQDMGPHARHAGVAELTDPNTLLVVVSADTAVGALLAREVVDAVYRTHGVTGIARTVVVLVGVFGRRRVRRRVSALLTAPAPAGVVALPADPALAVGGRIPLSRLSPSTSRSVEPLLHLANAGRRALSASGHDPAAGRTQPPPSGQVGG